MQVADCGDPDTPIFPSLHHLNPPIPRQETTCPTGSLESTNQCLAAIQQKLRLLTIMIWPSSITKVVADKPARSSRKSRQQRHPRIPERSFSFEPSRGIRMLDPERILHVGHTFHLMRQFLSSLPLFSGSHHASQMHNTTDPVDSH